MTWLLLAVAAGLGVATWVLVTGRADIWFDLSDAQALIAASRARARETRQVARREGQGQASQ